ncbi:MAG: hypothetical protein IIC85_13380 [Chloroflexi bacterium]|nr:hypothetical protein [Chloroflexota bacterium]
MTIAREIIDAIKLVNDTISNMRTFVDACQSGASYLRANYPDARDDLSAMCAELQKTFHGLAVASAVVTNFKFSVSRSALDTEPQRFNEHFIKHKAKASELHNQLNELRGHCHVINMHAENMNREAASNSFNFRNMFQFLGIDSLAREQELANALGQVYNEELVFVAYVDNMAKAVQQAMQAVQDALGPSGSMEAGNVLHASEVLTEHAALFAVLESRCSDSERDLQNILNSLA